MPCCMLGAMFLGQCLAVWAWIRRRLGIEEGTGRERRGIFAALGRCPKALVFMACFELLVGGAVLAYSGNELREHSSHTQTLAKLQRDAVCRAEDRPMQKT